MGTENGPKIVKNGAEKTTEKRDGKRRKQTAPFWPPDGFGGLPEVTGEVRRGKPSGSGQNSGKDPEGI